VKRTIRAEVGSEHPMAAARRMNQGDAAVADAIRKAEVIVADKLKAGRDEAERRLRVAGELRRALGE
jgi:hypothetical protein